MEYNYQMNRPIIRIKQIRMVEFKNVKDSLCQLLTNKQASGNDDRPCVLGLYGQNGSGKTAVIDALRILKYVMSGRRLPTRFIDYISVGADHAHLEYTFLVKTWYIKQPYEVVYSFDLRAETVSEGNEASSCDSTQSQKNARIVNEIVYYGGSLISDIFDEDIKAKTIKLQPIIRADLSMTPIGPIRKLNCLLGKKNRKSLLSKMDELKHQSYLDSKSFLFSMETLLLGLNNSASLLPPFGKKAFESEWKIFENVLSSTKDFAKFILGMRNVVIPDSLVDDEIDKLSPEELLELEQQYNGREDLLEKDVLLWLEGLQYWCTILFLIQFAREELFVVSTDVSGAIRQKKQLPLLTRSGTFDISLNDCFELTKSSLEKLIPYVNLVNEVLENLIPGLKLEIEAFEKKTGGKQNVRILSSRDGKKYPLRFEADGVIRLISLLWLIIPAFNDRSFVLAIDEIDAGIYEYLLGDILKAFENDGKGQLVFTSHNLRPLEVISKDSIVFTTTNPENRYIRLKRIGQTNNLRDVYLREIRMQDGEEELYKAERYYDISAAIQQVGIGYPDLEEEAIHGEE